MHLIRNIIVSAFLLLTAASCKKEEVVPQTGNLVVRFQYGADLSGARYSLFTEQVWTSAGRFAAPLRDGTIGSLASGATTGNATVTINDLNAGNYVFVISSVNSWSVQVTAGKTTEVTK